MNKKIITIAVVVVIVLGAGFFYGGMKYGQDKKFKSNGLEFNGGLPNQNNSTQARSSTRGNGAGGGFASGDIIAKDDKSITIKLNNGGSKIILYASSTQITKAATGSIDDLKVGAGVIVNGSANADGSITSQSIQIRPALPVSK
ncbi:MAG: hypothetical protein WCW02_04270 [Candidatus Buchananbacteria bacterium]